MIRIKCIYLQSPDLRMLFFGMKTPRDACICIYIIYPPMPNSGWRDSWDSCILTLPVSTTGTQLR